MGKYINCLFGPEVTSSLHTLHGAASLKSKNWMAHEFWVSWIKNGRDMIHDWVGGGFSNRRSPKVSKSTEVSWSCVLGFCYSIYVFRNTFGREQCGKSSSFRSSLSIVTHDQILTVVLLFHGFCWNLLSPVVKAFKPLSSFPLSLPQRFTAPLGT